MSWGMLSGSDGEASAQSPREPPGPALPAPPALAGTLPGRERLAYANVLMTSFVTERSGSLARHPSPGDTALSRGQGWGEPWCRAGPAGRHPSSPRAQPGCVFIWENRSSTAMRESALWLQQEEKEASVIISFADEKQQTEELLA